MVEISNKEKWTKRIHTIMSFISVEPVMLCWVFPAFLLFSSYENIVVEKVCRQSMADSKYNKDMCALLVRKDEFNVSCLALEDVSLNFDRIREEFAEHVDLLKQNTTEFVERLCLAETELQDRLSVVYSIRANLASIVPLIIILFAGSWSDKKGVRKPLMFPPIIGELLACVVCLVSAIYMDEIGPEIPAFGTRVIPSVFGGEQLMTMALYSYMAAISSDENRTMRFGIYSVIFSLVPIFATPLSHHLYLSMGYINLCILCLVIYVIGLIYTAVVLKEVSQVQTSDSTDQLDVEESKPKTEKTDCKTGCKEFFDYNLVKECLSVLYKKRENHMQLVFIVVLFTYVFNIMVPYGEGTAMYLFLRQVLNWDTEKYSYYLSYVGFLGLLGTLFMVFLLSKALKIADGILVILSVTLAVISRAIQGIAKTAEVFYVGATVDFSGPSKYIAIKSIVSKIVSAKEIGSAFAILTITEPLVGLIAPLIYGFVYNQTFEGFPNAIFWVGSFSHLISLIIFIFAYQVLRKVQPPVEEEEKTNTTNTNGDVEKNSESMQSTKL